MHIYNHSFCFISQIQTNLLKNAEKIEIFITKICSLQIPAKGKAKVKAKAKDKVKAKEKGKARQGEKVLGREGWYSVKGCPHT